MQKTFPQAKKFLIGYAFRYQKGEIVRAKKIIPAENFTAWHFDIRPELWPAMGVTLREYVDAAATKVLRKRAKAAGVEESKLVDIAHRVMLYALDAPPNYAFDEGDVFYAKHGNACIQIGKSRDAVIEVWVLDAGKYRYACHVADAAAVAAWLESGQEPAGTRIHRYSSFTELARLSVFPAD